MEKDNITMSRKQLNRFDVLSKVNAGFITVREASEALGLSERQVKRLKKKVRDGGAAGVVHGNAGRPPCNKTSEDTKEKILSLWQLPEHAGCNFMHFSEILAERYGMRISYPTLYRTLKQDGVKSPKTKRRKRPHRRRKRREQAGLLLQMDATPFAWFKGDRARYSIHGAIDDATGQITGLYMCKEECLHGYFETLGLTIKNFGVPVSAYADRHTIFQSPNQARRETDGSVTVNDTQFGRCLKELGVTLVAARSPQAKGRIERLWGTLQDRLPVDFAIRGIKTVHAANGFLAAYVLEFNAKFAVEPEKAQSAFRKLGPGEHLEHILCVKEERTVDAGGVFSYGGRSFRVVDTPGVTPIPAKSKVHVLVGSRIGIGAEWKGHVYEALPFVPPKRARAKTAKEPSPRVPVPPPADHTWRTTRLNMHVRTFDEYEEEDAYRETVRMLERTLLGKNR